LPYWQCRFRYTQTALPTAQPKMAIAIFGFGHTRAPDKDSEFARKYWQIWKITPKLDREKDRFFSLFFSKISCIFAVVI
jgi:hypothetical protein